MSRSLRVATALAISCAFVICWAFAHTLARNSDVGNSDAIKASGTAVSLSPSDPLVRFRYASDLEKTFDLSAISQSLKEYEAAVAASAIMVIATAVESNFI